MEDKGSARGTKFDSSVFRIKIIAPSVTLGFPQPPAPSGRKNLTKGKLKINMVLFSATVFRAYLIKTDLIGFGNKEVSTLVESHQDFDKITLSAGSESQN